MFRYRDFLKNGREPVGEALVGVSVDVCFDRDGDFRGFPVKVWLTVDYGSDKGAKVEQRRLKQLFA